MTLDQQTLADNANIPAGQTGSPWTITSDQLNPATPITLPHPPPSSNPDGTVAGATTPDINKIIASLTPAPTDADTQNQAILDSIAQLTGQDTGKTEALAQEKINAGVPDLQKTLTDLNGQITTKNAEYSQLDAQQQADLAKAEATSRSAFDYTGSSGAIQRQALALKATKAAEIGMLAARAQAVSGNLTTALTIAQNAVDAKYAPIEDDLKVKQAQLAAIQPELTKEEKTQALAQQATLQQQQQDLADKKAQEKTNVSTALTAGVSTKFINQNGTFYNTTTGEQYATPADFFKASGVSSFEQAYQQGLVTDLNNAKMQDINFAQQAQAKYPDVRIPVNSTPDEVAQILKGSRIYQKETYGGMVNGLPVLTIAQTVTVRAANTAINNSKTGIAYQNASTSYGAIQTIDANTTVPSEQQQALLNLAQLEFPGTNSAKGLLNINPADSQDSHFTSALLDAQRIFVQKGRLAPGVIAQLQSQATKLFNNIQSSYDSNFQANAKSLAKTLGISQSDAAQYLTNYNASANSTNTIPKGTDGASYGYPGYVSDGTQWVKQ